MAAWGLQGGQYQDQPENIGVRIEAVVIITELRINSHKRGTATPNWSFDNDCVERGKAGQRIPGWNWEEKSGDEKEKVSLSGFFRGTFSAFSDERTRRLITTRFS